MNYSNRYSDNIKTHHYVIILVCIVIILTVGTSMTKDKSRTDHNMIVIRDGYCYEADTHIVYLESESGRYGDTYVYTAYYNENGKLCYYNERTKEWLEIKEKN